MFGRNINSLLEKCESRTQRRSDDTAVGSIRRWTSRQRNRSRCPEGNSRGASILLCDVFQSEQATMLVTRYQDRLFSSQNDPRGTLLRDGIWTKDDTSRRSQSIQHLHEQQVLRLKELIDQQKKHIQTLRNALVDVQRRLLAVKTRFISNS